MFRVCPLSVRLQEPYVSFRTPLILSFVTKSESRGPREMNTSSWEKCLVVTPSLLPAAARIQLSPGSFAVDLDNLSHTELPAVRRAEQLATPH